MKKPKITVYVVSHNYGKYLQEAIESVLRQTVDGWELLLIDDGSSDNTQDIIQHYKGDPRIRIFKTAGIGLPSVANFAHKHTRGEYIIRLDGDDIFDENILLVLGNYLDKHPEIALVFPDHFLIDDTGGIIRYEGRRTLYHRNHLLDASVNGACTLIRKEVLKTIGGYREDLGAQDGFDLWTKVFKQYKSANVNIPLFYYRRHGENLTENEVRILSARRIIKKDACADTLEKFRPIVAVIPCRRHYDVYSNLWSKKLNGKTLLDITLETCIASSILDKIVVTSDNPDVRKVMKKYRDKRLCFIERSRESTIDSRSIVYTLESIMSKLGLNNEGIAVLSYVKAPFTTPETLEEAVYTLVLNNADSAFSVEEVHEHLYRRTPHGLIPMNYQDKFKSDFDVFYTNTYTSIASRNSNFKTGSLAGARVSCFVIPKDEAFFIETKMDFEIAKILKRKKAQGERR